MATETESGDELGPKARHRRSITVTTVASLAGVAAGVLSDVAAAGPTDRLGLTVLAGAAAVAFGAVHVAGVDVSEFSKKDVAYVVFMTFALWFITWTILLTSAG